MGIERLLRAVEELLLSASSGERVLIYRRYPELLTRDSLDSLDNLIRSSRTAPFAADLDPRWSRVREGLCRLQTEVRAGDTLEAADRLAGMPELVESLRVAPAAAPVILARSAGVERCAPPSAGPARAAPARRASWAALARQLLALDDWELLPAVVAAARETGDHALLDALQAFGTRDPRRLNPQALPLHKALIADGRDEEAGTVALLDLHLQAARVLAVTLAPPQAQSAILQEALDACDRASDIAGELGDELCMTRYFAWMALGMELCGRLEEAEKGYWLSVQIWGRHVREHPSLRHHMAAAHLQLAQLYQQGQQWEAAHEGFQQAEQIYAVLIREDPGEYRPLLAAARQARGSLLVDLARWEEALALLRNALPPLREAARREPEEWEPPLASALGDLGIVLRRLRQPGEAAAVTGEAIQILRRLAGTDPVQFRPLLADALSNLGNVLTDLRQYDEALAAQREALGLQSRR